MITRAELERAREKVATWPAEDRRQLLELEPNERAWMLLLAGELDADPVHEAPAMGGMRR